MTKTTRLEIQAFDLSDLHRVAGFSIRDRVKSSDIQRDVRYTCWEEPVDMAKTCSSGKRLWSRPRTPCVNILWFNILWFPQWSWWLGEEVFGLPSYHPPTWTWISSWRTVFSQLQFFSLKKSRWKLGKVTHFEGTWRVTWPTVEQYGKKRLQGLAKYI